MILQITPQKMLSLHCPCGMATAATRTGAGSGNRGGCCWEMTYKSGCDCGSGGEEEAKLFWVPWQKYAWCHGQRVTGDMGLKFPPVMAQKEAQGMMETSSITRGILMSKSFLEIESLKIQQESRTRETRNMSLSTGGKDSCCWLKIILTFF